MKYFTRFFVIMLLAFCSCINSVPDEAFPAIVNLDHQTQRYRSDKASIERTYMDNIESYRLSRLQQDGYVVNEDSINPEIAEGFFIYTPYILKISKDGKSFINQTRTDESISLVVDTLTYSQDSLLCMALVIVKVKNEEKLGSDMPEDSCCYDGRAIIGMRKNKDIPFYLFPYRQWTLLGCNNYSITRTDLRNFYFNRIRELSSLDGKKMSGIGDPEFFKSSPEFKTDSSGSYAFESFMDLGKRYHYYNYKE